MVRRDERKAHTPIKHIRNVYRHDTLQSPRSCREQVLAIGQIHGDGEKLLHKLHQHMGLQSPILALKGDSRLDILSLKAKSQFGTELLEIFHLCQLKGGNGRSGQMWRATPFLHCRRIVTKPWIHDPLDKLIHLRIGRDQIGRGPSDITNFLTHDREIATITDRVSHKHITGVDEVAHGIEE